MAAILAILLVSLISISVLAGLMDQSGLFLETALGGFGFLGLFLKNLGQILRMLISITAAITAAGVLSSYAGRMGINLQKHYSRTQTKVVGTLMAMLAGAIIFVLIGAGINWLYQIENPLYWGVLPGIAGAFAGIDRRFSYQKDRSFTNRTGHLLSDPDNTERVEVD